MSGSGADADGGEQFATIEGYWADYAPGDSVPVADRVHWTQYPGHGPGAEFVGSPRTALELGAATCAAGVALARTTGAEVTCIDFSPEQVARSRKWWSSEPGVTIVEADVLDYLAETDRRWELIFSDWGAVFFIDPQLLLPLIIRRLAPGGLLAFSCVEALHPCYGPQVLYGNGYRGKALPIVRWMYTPEQWARMLEHHGYVGIDVTILPAGQAGHVGTLMGRAYRPLVPSGAN